MTRNDDTTDGTQGLEKRAVQKHTERWLDAYMAQTASENRGSVLTNYPNTGKSFGFHKAAAEREEPATILQPNRDLRAETAEKAREAHGITVEDLPSFPEESPLLDKDSGWYSSVAESWYNRGMPPRKIYEELDDDLVPPSAEDGYRRKMDTDLPSFDLLMGDPVHAFLKNAMEDRHVALDDIDPYSSFVDEFDLDDDGVQREVMEYVEHHRRFLLQRGMDVKSFSQVRDPSPGAQRALQDLVHQEDVVEAIPDTEHVTVDVEKLLKILAERPDGGRVRWVDPAEREELGSGTKCTGARVDEHVIVASLPLNLRRARTLLMLSATPVLPVFEQVFEDLEMKASVEDTMTRDQKERYFDDILGTDVVQTTRSSRFVSGGNNVRPDKFRLTVREVEERHGRKPVVISSKKALHGPLADAVDDLGVETLNFAKAIGTNRFADESLALVWGAPHYGDDYVKRVAAFCGDHDAEAIREDPTTGERVETYWTTDTAQQIYEHMCEGTVFQAMLRIGRETDERSTIYVETDKIPDDVPRIRPEGRDMFRLLTDAERQVQEAAEELEVFSAREIAERTTCSRRTVYDVLSRFADEGVLEQVGTGKYGAKQFKLLLDAAADGVLSESVRETLNSIIMQKTHDLVETEPMVDPTRRVLRAQNGRDPSEIDPDAPDETQLDLGVWAPT